MKVVVVFDVDYGGRGDADLGDAFWLIESPPNRTLATRVWAAGATDPNSAVFKANSPTEDQALERFEDVELHHPGWTEIAFVGVPLTRDLDHRFRERLLIVASNSAGFLVRR